MFHLQISCIDIGYWILHTAITLTVNPAEFINYMFILIKRSSEIILQNISNKKYRIYHVIYKPNLYKSILTRMMWI